MPICARCGTGLPVGHSYCYECGLAVNAKAPDETAGAEAGGAAAGDPPASWTTPQAPYPPAYGAPLGPPPAQSPYGPPQGPPPYGPPGQWTGPWAGPAAPPPAAVAGRLVGERWPRRLGAFVIDSALGFAVVLAVWMPIMLGSGWVSSDGTVDQKSLQGSQLLIAATMVLVMYLYLALSEGMWAATLGKRAFGLTVVMDDGRRLTWGASLLRNLFKIVPLVVFSGFYLVTLIMIAVDGQNRRLGDMAAHTRVVGVRPRVDAWGR